MLPALLRVSDDGVRVRVGCVVAGAGVVVLDGDVENPPEDRLHCPPAFTWVGLHDESTISSLRFHHPRTRSAPPPRARGRYRDARERQRQRALPRYRGAASSPSTASGCDAARRCSLCTAARGLTRANCAPPTTRSLCSSTSAARAAQRARRSSRARSSRWQTTSPRFVIAWVSSTRSSSVAPPAGSSRCISRCVMWSCRAGLIVCDSAPTLAPLPDEDPPAALAERAGADAVAVAQRLFAGDFSSRARRRSDAWSSRTTPRRRTSTFPAGRWPSAA